MGVFGMRWLANVMMVVLLVVACGGDDDAEPTSPAGTTPATEQHQHQHQHDNSPVAGEGSEAMEVFLVASELVVGPNRFAVGLTLPDNSIIDEADVTFEYFDLSDPSAPKSEATTSASRLSSLDGLTVIYADERSFDRAGAWGVRIVAELPDGTTLERNISFDVLADSEVLAVGEQVPAIDSPVAADVDGDLTLLTSASTPNPAFYELSIDDALANDKPTVILFATPAYCQTRFCGPDYEITSDFQQRYGDQFNFIHVEVFEGLPNPAASNWQYAQPLLDFGLQTEPWLFVADADGVVSWRIEGLFTEAEVVAALEAVGLNQ